MPGFIAVCDIISFSLNKILVDFISVGGLQEQKLTGHCKLIFNVALPTYLKCLVRLSHESQSFMGVWDSLPKKVQLQILHRHCNYGEWREERMRDEGKTPQRTWSRGNAKGIPPSPVGSHHCC